MQRASGNRILIQLCVCAWNSVLCQSLYECINPLFWIWSSTYSIIVHFESIVLYTGRNFSSFYFPTSFTPSSPRFSPRPLTLHPFPILSFLRFFSLSHFQSPYSLSVIFPSHLSFRPLPALFFMSPFFFPSLYLPLLS